MSNGKTWGIGFLALTLVLLVCAASLTGIIDPFFHYHAPLDTLQYPLNNQRYQNDGIVRHFSYDAVITGTSLTENFKSSEFDDLFGTNSIKVCYSGGTFEEINNNLRRALHSNPKIRMVLFGLDEWFLFSGKDLIQADGAYPTYLYDDNPFNDVQYLLNKEILLENTWKVLEHTKSGEPTTSFDAYSSWTNELGWENVVPDYVRPEKAAEESSLTEELAQMLREHIQQDVLALAREYPDTQFIYFFPPYSILNWDSHNREGILRQTVEGMAMASELLMQEPNIQVYSFCTDYDTITDLNNYSDDVHYSAQINSLLLQRIARQEYRITPANHQAHWDEVMAFYTAYDYDALFAQ